jgi:cell division protease FtsH
MILQVHSRGQADGSGLDLLASRAARRASPVPTSANVLNEAALLTARQQQKLIDNAALDEAIDRVIAGPQRAPA